MRILAGQSHALVQPCCQIDQRTDQRKLERHIRIPLVAGKVIVNHTGVEVTAFLHLQSGQEE